MSKRLIPKVLINHFKADLSVYGRSYAFDTIRNEVIDRYGYFYWKGNEKRIFEELANAESEEKNERILREA